MYVVERQRGLQESDGKSPWICRRGVTVGPEAAISVAEENRGQVLRNPGASGPRIWGPLLWESCWGWEDGGGECWGGRWKVKLQRTDFRLRKEAQVCLQSRCCHRTGETKGIIPPGFLEGGMQRKKERDAGRDSLQGGQKTEGLCQTASTSLPKQEADLPRRR